MANPRCEKCEPHYGLADIKACFAASRFEIPRRVGRYMERQEWTVAYLVASVGALTPEDFHKSQKHEVRADAWLDIYRPRLDGSRLYIKFTELDGVHGYAILSFCRDGEAH